jgi:hypothetical protein
MDLDRFNVAVHRVQAGQFLREKTALAVGVSAIDAALQARAGQAEDPDLFKIATQLCPEDALGFYVKLGGNLAKKPDWAGNTAEMLAKDEKEFPKRPKGESTNEYVDRTDREWATKKAEPAPPKGVSMKDWDRILNQPEKG